MSKNTLSDVHTQPERQNLCADLIKPADMLSDSLKVHILRYFVKLNSLETEWGDLVAKKSFETKSLLHRIVKR